MRFPINYIDVKDFSYDSNNIIFGYCPDDPYVYSIGDGEVIYSHYQSKYSNVVYIKHGNGLISMYKRLENVTVEVGQKVKNGEIIGEIGSTLGSNKKFLLFGLFSDGADYLNGQGDLDLFDYLSIYSNQEVTLSTVNRYGIKLKYHELYSNEKVLVENNDVILNDYNLYKYGSSWESILIYFLSLIFIIIFIILFFVKKNSRRYK